jgi:hypothetical protein
MLAWGLASFARAAPQSKQPTPRRTPVWEVQNQRDLRGAVQSAAFDEASGTAYLATLANLYEVQDGKVRPVSKPPAPGAQVQLAPGGKLFAWLVPDQRPQGMYDILLMDITGRRLAELRLDDPPLGFGALVLGHEGRLIVTATPLDDPQGVHGRFQYSFWSRDGKLLERVVRPQREIPVAGADGASLLLLGEKEANAYAADGKRLWTLDGRFRKGAIAREGRVALLNPAERKAIDQVHVFSGQGRPGVVKMPTPVHHLRLSPDGAAAVVGGDRGRYFFLDPGTRRVSEGAKVPVESGLFLSDLQLVDRDTVAIGVLKRRGKEPRHTWPQGAVVVLNRAGRTLMRAEYPISEPLASRPAVSASYGVPMVVTFTLDTAQLWALGR